MLFEWNDLTVVITFHYRIKKQKFIQISNTIVNTIAQFAGWKCKTNFILNYIFIKNVYVYIYFTLNYRVKTLLGRCISFSGDTVYKSGRGTCFYFNRVWSKNF